MRTDTRWLRGLAVLCLLAVTPALEAEAADQIHVGPATEVRNIRFAGAHSLPESDLRRILQTRERAGAYGLRNLLGKLPFVPGPPHFAFRPLVLQEDVVRLRRSYQAAGFLGTQVHYEVTRAGSEDLLDVTFVIDEGEPQIVVAADIVPADTSALLHVRSDDRKSWARIEKKVSQMVGRRIDAATILERHNQISTWWWNHGHAEALVRVASSRDTVRNELRLTFVVDAGTRSRFGDIDVRGNQNISEQTVLRGLPFKSGDDYSEAKLLQGRRSLNELPIIRAARVEASTFRDTSRVTAGTDSIIPIQVTVAEAKPRLVSGQVGYVTDGGLSSEASWTHRNFRNSARVFTVSALAQTGVLALARDPDRRYRGSVSLQQPHLFHPRLAGIVSPFVEYREDLQVRGLEAGSNFTLIYRLRDFISGSLDYRIAWRRIYEYRLDDLEAGNIDLLTFLATVLEGQLDSLGSYSRSSLLTLSMTASLLDQITNPQRGILVRPTLQVTAPSGWSTLNYWRADAAVYGYLPLLPRTTLASRLSTGRVFPFGKSLPANEDEVFLQTLRLREVSFTAGGSGDVRGWGYRMLGPKLPDLRYTQQGDSLDFTADGYVPQGAMSRVTFSLELRLPLPLLGPNFGSHVFLDGGRVWTQDQRFITGPDEFDESRFFYGTGAGIDVLSPVGSIKFGLGYKLNPSILDLVDSRVLLEAADNGTPVEDIPREQSRRWAFYFALGSSF